MSGTVFLVWNKENYFYRWEDECVRPGILRSDMINLTGRICQTLHADKMLKCLITKKIKHADKIIMTDVCFEPYLYKTLSGYCRPENIFLYYMNTIGPRNQIYMDGLRQRTYSFDKEDAKRYGIGYKHLPYSGKVKIRLEDPQYDTVFLGLDKGRISKIRNADKILKDNGLEAKIMVPYSNDQKYQIPAFIKYTEYLEYVAKSRSILELNTPGQTSCTLRLLESVFLKKKLITDNEYVITDPYYDPDNIFVLGSDDPGRLKDFVMTPYIDKRQDLSEATFANWIHGW